MHGNGLQGILFNIQRYTVHDGPGIRTEVFFKGCPLHCKWCSNPEGINSGPELGVYTGRCIGVDKCGCCLTSCPVPGKPVFAIEDNKVTGIDRLRCTGCEKCTQCCPSGGLVVWGKRMTVEEVMKSVLADLDFYRTSGGGVTLSGGEVLLQWKFALALLKECKRHDIHTCVESSLHVDPKILDHILPYTDLVITDIKHMGSEQHRLFTGVVNKRILENIKKVAQAVKPLVIRIPVVPHHNDSKANIRASAAFIIDELKNQVVQVQLLPYRQLGEEKYTSLEIHYPMAGHTAVERTVREKNILELAKLMKSFGVPAAAGTTSKIHTNF